MSAIEWQSNIGFALDAGISTKRPILLDYYNPE